MDENVIEFEIPVEKVETTEEVIETTHNEEDVVEDSTNNTDDNFNALDYLKEKLNSSTENTESTNNVVEEVNSNNEEQTAYTWAEKTGRDPQDFFRLHKDWSKEESDVVLKTFLKEKNPHWTEADILDEIEDRYSVDPLANDEDKAKRKADRLYKDDVAAAKSYLSENFSSVKQDAGKVEIPQEYQNAFNEFEQIKTERQIQEQKFSQNRQHYIDVLNETYQDYKGFDYSFEVTDGNGTKQDVQISFVPPQSQLQETIDIQNDTNKLFDRFGKVDENGDFRFTDGKGFMKVLAAAANLENILRLTYEQGAASATENLVKNDLKNINISGGQKQNTSNSGFSFSVE